MAEYVVRELSEEDFLLETENLVPKKPSRFENYDEHELDTIESHKDEKSTGKQTAWGVKMKNYRSYRLFINKSSRVYVRDSAGIETRHIMHFTAHKNEASVRSYTNKLTVEQSQGISGILSQSLGGGGQSKSHTAERSHDSGMSGPHVSISDDNIAANFASQQPSTSAGPRYISKINTTNAASALFQNCTFSGPINVQIVNK